MFPIVRLIRRNNVRRQNLQLLRLRRKIRESYNPFKLPDARFIELYRLNKNMVRQLIALLTPHLNAPTTVRGISIERKILVALRFYATGAYQRNLGEEYNFGISQTIIHFIIHEVTLAISSHYLVNEFIKFPITREARDNNKINFMEKFGFPGVIGCIDGTHIAILKPGQDEEHNFFNRKGDNLFIINSKLFIIDNYH